MNNPLTRRLAILVVATFAFWAALAFPSQRLWGTAAVIYNLVAAVICLIPSALTLVWASRADSRDPQQQLRLVVGGMGLRVLSVLGAAATVHLLFPYFDQLGFWVSIAVFYLVTLGLETYLALAGNKRPAAE